MDEARFTMRIHPIIMSKMKIIAKNNGRSLNKEIEQILKWVIDDYERKCGRITYDQLNVTVENAEANDLSSLYK